MKTLLVALTATLGLATAARADITGDQLARAAGRVAATPGAQMRVKDLCVCQDGSANHYHVGYLIASTLPIGNLKYHLTMACQIPNISTVDQSISSSQNCLTFAPLVD
jgi:hypothetical protein